jgi:uncharacterized DUF497 family protein
VFDAVAFGSDEGKTLKCQNHGMSLAEIELLAQSTPLVAPDIAHSQLEDRLVAIGEGTEGRPIFVNFIFRQRGESRVVWPVSARYMREKEFLRYAKTST